MLQYLIIGVIICIISMTAYEWPNSSDGFKDWFSTFVWVIFILFFWPLVLGVWILGGLLQYFSKDSG